MKTITIKEYEGMSTFQKMGHTFVRESDGKAWRITLAGPYPVDLQQTPPVSLILILDKTFTLQQLTEEHGLTLLQAIEYQWKLEQERRTNKPSWKI